MYMYAWYGLIGILRAILANNLAKYQYFSMRSSLFDKYHQITYSRLQVSAENAVFMIDYKSDKNSQKWLSYGQNTYAQIIIIIIIMVD